MNNYKTLIILDWDDTIFPTSWIARNNINLNDNVLMKNKYFDMFSILDSILCKLFTKFLIFGKVLIVTNASAKWVNISAQHLPNLLKIINKSITIISARDLFQNEYPDKIYLWKKLTFNKLIISISQYKLQNILSIGDAEYEFNATIDLYNEYARLNQRLLKTIRFMKNPSFDDLIDELNVLYLCSENIIKNINHVDLMFKIK